MAVITVITPTCDRPAGISLLERWMERQTVQPDRWIVADGGTKPAVLTMDQDHAYIPGLPGAANFTSNVLRAVSMVHVGSVIIMEDDDWYAPTHIEKCVEALKHQRAYGTDRMRYYNVQHKAWVEWRNQGSTLAQTAMRACTLPHLEIAARKAMEAGDYTIDGRFWAQFPDLANGTLTSIGIKGLPGTKGLGVGHKPDGRWSRDPKGLKLREWIGDDADCYHF